MKRPIRTVFVLLIFLFLTNVIYQIWISYRRLEVNAYSVEVKTSEKENSSKKQESVSLSLAILSDLHGNVFGKENEHLISQIVELEPDIILLDGDMLNEDADSHQPVIDLICALRERTECPVYYAVGNHELGYAKKNPCFWEDIRQAGAVYLEQEYADLEVKGQKLRIGGLYEYTFALDDFNSPDTKKMDADTVKFLQEFQNTDSYKILLAHRPDSFIFAQKPDAWKIDLAICGHIHGGQVVLPFVGGLWAPDQGYFPKYEHGKYNLGELTMLITSGLGSHKETLPRFGNPPEIMLAEIIFVS